MNSAKSSKEIGELKQNISSLNTKLENVQKTAQQEVPKKVEEHVQKQSNSASSSNSSEWTTGQLATVAATTAANPLLGGATAAGIWIGKKLGWC